MRLTPMLPAVLLALVLSVLVGVLGVARRSELTLALAAALFAAQVLFVLLRVNVPLWRSKAAAAASAAWAWDNSVLTALTYAWGGVAMFALYSIGGLSWRHWWQYGAGMLLFAFLTMLCAGHFIGTGGATANGEGLRKLVRMTQLQVAAIIVALIYLFASGKLSTLKDDWAANEIFIAGGLTILVISLASLATYQCSRKPQPSA